MFTQIDDAFDWIESFTNLEKNTKDLKRKYRPDRMTSLLDHFGNPQNEYKIIHLAGSKGKGSTSVLLSAALKEKGFRTGLYTSPHVLHYRERIQIDNESLSDDEYVEAINFIRNNLTCDLPGDTEPTTFELLTLLGFLLFKIKKCDWCVLETGLGGRLDATNAVDPDAVVLTPIEKEHTQWLGDDLISIAGEKAGIIKMNKPVFSAPQNDEVRELFEQTAQKCRSAFYYLPDYIASLHSEINLTGTTYTIEGKDGTRTTGQLCMPGEIQVWNAALALQVLSRLYPDEPVKTWVKGFGSASLPARMEILSRNPLVICDGSHTPRSVTMALKTFNDLTGSPEKMTLLFACQDDKEVNTLAALLAEEFTNVIITTPGYFKKSNPSKVHDAFYSLKRSCILEVEPGKALELALSMKEPVLIMGSFFLAGEIKKIYRGIK